MRERLMAQRLKGKKLIFAGVALAIIGFLFIDAYIPQLGAVWNLLNGSICLVHGKGALGITVCEVGIGYKWVLLIALGLVGRGIWLNWGERART